MKINKRNILIKSKIKFGIKIPNNTKESLELDDKNWNKKWAEEISIEMDALERMKWFQYYDDNNKFMDNNSYQYENIRMIFYIKHKDLRHKARLVVGGHMIDSSMHNTYSLNVQGISFKILFIIAVKHNAFPMIRVQKKCGQDVDLRLEIWKVDMWKF